MDLEYNFEMCHGCSAPFLQSPFPLDSEINLYEKFHQSHLSELETLHYFDQMVMFQNYMEHHQQMWKLLCKNCWHKLKE